MHVTTKETKNGVFERMECSSRVCHKNGRISTLKGVTLFGICNDALCACFSLCFAEMVISFYLQVLDELTGAHLWIDSEQLGET